MENIESKVLDKVVRKKAGFLIRHGLTVCFVAFLLITLFLRLKYPGWIRFL